jgi:hypothetical protein
MPLNTFWVAAGQNLLRKPSQPAVALLTIFNCGSYRALGHRTARRPLPGTKHGPYR